MAGSSHKTTYIALASNSWEYSAVEGQLQEPTRKSGVTATAVETGHKLSVLTINQSIDIFSLLGLIRGVNRQYPGKCHALGTE